MTFEQFVLPTPCHTVQWRTKCLNSRKIGEPTSNIASFFELVIVYTDQL